MAKEKQQLNEEDALLESLKFALDRNMLSPEEAERFLNAYLAHKAKLEADMAAVIQKTEIALQAVRRMLEANDLEAVEAGNYIGAFTQLSSELYEENLHRTIEKKQRNEPNSYTNIIPDFYFEGTITVKNGAQLFYQPQLDSDIRRLIAKKNSDSEKNQAKLNKRSEELKQTADWGNIISIQGSQLFKQKSGWKGMFSSDQARELVITDPLVVKRPHPYIPDELGLYFVIPVVQLEMSVGGGAWGAGGGSPHRVHGLRYLNHELESEKGTLDISPGMLVPVEKSGQAIIHGITKEELHISRFAQTQVLFE